MTRPYAVTVAAVTERRGRFLMVEERIGHRLLCNQPAGHVEPGETLLAAVVRETFEETAWHFTPRWLIGVYLWRHPSGRRAFLRYAFAGTVAAHVAEQPLDAGIVRACWLTPQEIAARRTRHRSPLVLRCVHDYLRGLRRPLAQVASLDAAHAAARAHRPGSRGTARVCARCA